jgi:D-sedoheptulose 7-phosphate isomerase
MSASDHAGMVARVTEGLQAAAQAHTRMAASVESIVTAATAIRQAIDAGRTVFAFGNGGSAADAQHFVAELVGWFETKRPALAAVALTTDTSILTAVGNDAGFDRVFARQLEALGRPGDVAIGITTSGQSPNVLRALETAATRGLTTVALTGRDGGEAGRVAAIHVNVAETQTPRIQEVHMTVLHMMCELVDEGRER